MDLIVDGQRDLEFDSNWTTIADVLEGIDATLRERGRGMLSVTCDGNRVLPEQLLEVLGDKTLDDVAALEIQSEALMTLAAKSVKEMEEVIPELAVACHGLAELFQSETPEQGFEKFEQLAEIWSTVKTRQELVASALGLDLGELIVDGDSVAKRHGDLNRFLEESAEALESRDLVSLGDLLEYELAPRAADEERIVGLLKAHLEGRSG